MYLLSYTDFAFPDGEKNEVSFFISFIHMLFCGACTTEACLSATDDVKESVRQLAISCVCKDSTVKML